MSIVAGRRPASPVAGPLPVVASATDADPSYQGLVTRAIAFVLDAAIINVAAAIFAIATALALSVLHLPSSLDPVLVALGGGAYIAWSAGYFVVFWSSTGQTPGDRVMRIRVCMADGGAPRPLRSLVRLVALVVAAIPLGAGFIPVLFDDRRRGFQDMVARTVVVGVVDPVTTTPFIRSG